MNEKIYKGSSKTLYKSDKDYELIMSFNDSLAIPNKDPIEIFGKGIINNSISSCIMQKLDMIGIENHLIRKTNMRQQMVQFIDVYPIQVNICTIACGRYVSDFGMEDGFVFDSPIIDFRVKNKELGYPVINESQITSFCWLSKKELNSLKTQAIRIYDFLSGLFASLQIRLVDIQLEFGHVFNGEDFLTTLVDEISPDTCRLWDMQTNEKLCYEIAETEKSPEKIMSAYQEVLRRLIPQDSNISNAI